MGVSADLHVSGKLAARGGKESARRDNWKRFQIAEAVASTGSAPLFIEISRNQELKVVFRGNRQYIQAIDVGLNSFVTAPWQRALDELFPSKIATKIWCA